MDLIEPTKMTKILTEVHLLEAKIDQIGISPKDSASAVYFHFENLLFEEMGVTKEQYENSFNYYLDHPKEFEKIYTTVVDSLLQKEKTARQ